MLSRSVSVSLGGEKDGSGDGKGEGEWDEQDKGSTEVTKCSTRDKAVRLYLSTTSRICISTGG